MRLRVRRVLLPSVAGALVPASLLATDYLTPAQARAQMFPSGTRFERLPLDPGAPWVQELRKRTGAFQGSLEVALQGSRPLGYLVIDEVIGRFERITFAVGIDAGGAVTQVEILSYRESHGQEVRLPSWRRQFKGRTARSALVVGQDVFNVSGATLSCTHVTEGVRRAVQLVDAGRSAGKLP